MGEPVLKKFGKYFLLDRIGEGGMAEIFRARLGDRNTADRLVVIKRIHASSSNNQEFVQMFKSEIQVTMRFSHPNIVQLYEAGEESGQQFISMELVDGRNLRQILGRLSTRKEKFPLEVACSIIEQVANGLHYAHTFKDKITGTPLNLVHRDVSPQNIIVSYEGNIKVIDFGIAKAATNAEATRAGVIKGKLSYLSPEQVTGEVLDARSDVFALGIVLWECLTGRRLFVTDGDNEFQVLKMIEACTSFVKKPSEFEPSIPPELDFIVLQALARDRKKRFQSADELGRALRRFLATHNPDFSSTDISIYIKRMFSDLIVDDRKQLQDLSQRSEELLHLVEQPSASKKGVPIADGTRVTSFLGDRFDRNELAKANKVEVTGTAESKISHQVIARPTLPKTAATTSAQRFVREATSAREMQHRETASAFGNSLSKIAMIVGVIVGGFLVWDNFGRHFTGSTATPLEANVSHPVGGLDQSLSPNEGIILKLRLVPDVDPSRTRILVNRNPLEPGVRQVTVRPSEPIQIAIEHPGFLSYSKEFSLKATDVATDRVWEEKISLEPMNFGRLSIYTTPSLADVRIIRIDGRGPASDEKPWVLRAPFEGQKIPVGQYRLIVENPTLGMKSEETITVKDGSDLKLNVQLKVGN